MTRRPWVDKDNCTGCGLCVDNLPDVFWLDADGLAECHNPAGASEVEIDEEAVEICPAECIHWI
jgi:ferredoxin